MRLFKSESLPMGSQANSGLSRYSNNKDEGPSDRGDPLGVSSHSARSADSEDSGISDPGEDYSFVITENSPSELVRRVEQEFIPVENINLIITGKACPRMLSGYQKSRMEEQAILDSLREEGFISTGKTKTGGGMAFEVVEATPDTVKSASSINSYKPQDFLPLSAQKKMEERRQKYGPGEKTAEMVEQKRSAAQERREADLSAKKEKMAEQIKGSLNDKKMEELAAKQESKTNAALQKREAHLKELRDRLKAQNQRAQQVKLKHLINAPPVPVPMTANNSNSYGFGMSTTDIFFD